MNEEKVTALLETVSQTVLSKIKQMSSNQKTELPLIGLDSLALSLKVPMANLLPILEHLQGKGEVIIHPNVATNSRSTKKYGKVSLVTN